MTNQKKKSQKNVKGQKAAVLNYLLSGHTLTTKEASDRFGCTRLPARISDYRREGYKIGESWEQGETRYGTPTRYKKYAIIG